MYLYMKTVTLAEEYAIAHAECLIDSVLGKYDLVWQISTKDELPRTWFCYLPADSKTLDGPFYLVELVECIDLLEQTHEQKITKFKTYEGADFDEVGLYAKVIVIVNGYSVYGYLPIETLKEL